MVSVSRQDETNAPVDSKINQNEPADVTTSPEPITVSPDASSTNPEPNLGTVDSSDAYQDEPVTVRTSAINEERETLTESQVLEMLDDAEVTSFRLTCACVCSYPEQVASG